MKECQMLILFFNRLKRVVLEEELCWRMGCLKIFQLTKFMLYTIGQELVLVPLVLNQGQLWHQAFHLALYQPQGVGGHGSGGGCVIGDS